MTFAALKNPSTMRQKRCSGLTPEFDTSENQKAPSGPHRSGLPVEKREGVGDGVTLLVREPNTRDQQRPAYTHIKLNLQRVLAAKGGSSLRRVAATNFALPTELRRAD
jgi:hypothetical protein